MKYIAPSYYNKFKCIADKCRHSCCIGWEIDIDEDTLEKYRLTTGEFGKRLNENIDIVDDTACFKLSENERCPFLNEKNLCDIILKLGENSLCQICNDHPRFRNFYNGTTEIGLGLCCEEAARIILSEKEKVTFIVIESNGFDDENYEEENDFLIFRESLFRILQDRNQSFDERIKMFLSLCVANKSEMGTTELADFLLGLERLDEKWTILLNELKNTDFSNSTSFPCCFDTIFEQLAVYFTYRHLSASLDDGRLSQRASFVAFSIKVLSAIYKYHHAKFGDISENDIIEYARLYSSEIEYSEENIEAILKLFE